MTALDESCSSMHPKEVQKKLLHHKRCKIHKKLLGLKPRELFKLTVHDTREQQTDVN